MTDKSKVNPPAGGQKSKLIAKSKKSWDLGFGIWDLPRSGFTLIELIISVALLIVAISIALFAVIGSNGLIQKADARSAISESTRGVGEAIRRTVDNAPVGAVSPIIPNDDGKTFAAVQVKSFSNLQSGNTCTVIGRAQVNLDPSNSGEEKYTFAKDGTLIALTIHNVDSGGLCPQLSTDPIYQNRLTNSQAIVKDSRFFIQNLACTVVTSSCVTKQLLRYSLTLEMALKGSGGTSEARKPTLTVQDGLPIGLVNEATTVLKIDTPTLSGGTVGEAYSRSVVASGGMPSYSWSITAGALPTGLSLAPTTGIISGTPTVANSFNFTVRVADSANPVNVATKDLSITVVAAPSPLTITTTSLPGGTEGVSYSQTASATGGTGSYTWSLNTGSGPLPPGLTLTSGTQSATISGTPTAAGTYNFVLKVVDGDNNSDTQALTIIIGGAGGGGAE